MPRPRYRPHIDEPLDRIGREQRRETLDRQGRMADGEDRAPGPVPVIRWGGNAHGSPRYRGARNEIGRASGRERVCKYVSISVVAVSLKKQTTAHKKRDETVQ